MSVEVINESIFTSDCEVLVNPVNCVGVMGKGLAEKFKYRYFDYFNRYKALCESNQIEIGKVDFYIQISFIIASFPTKKHWRNNSDYRWIETGLKDLHRKLVENKFGSVALPFLGCGLGRLNKDIVLQMINKEFENSNIIVKIYDI